MLLSQVLFLVSGYGVHVFLARLLGPQDFGVYGVIYSLLMVFELFVVAGIPNALQRFIGENPARASTLHGMLFRWQLGYSLVVFAGAVALAPLIAGLFSAPAHATLLQIAAIDIVFFAFYWYFNGVQIGLKNFGKQTIIASTYSISKFIFIVLLVNLGFAVTGAFIGNILGSICGLALGVWFFRLQRQTSDVASAPVREFIVANVLYSVGLNLFFYIDLWFVEYHSAPEVVGFYTAASLVARIPYFFAIALTGALMPSLAFAVGQGLRPQIERIVQQSLRVMLAIAGFAVAITAGSAPELATLFFGEAYHASGAILQILMAGLSVFAIFAVLNTIAMTGTGMTACTKIVFALLPVDVVLNLMLVPKYGATGAATATSLTMLIGAGISAWYVRRTFQTLLPLRPLLRITIAAALVFAVSIWLPMATGIALVLKYLALALLFAILLIITGEIGREELAMLKSLIPGTRKIDNVVGSAYVSKDS